MAYTVIYTALSFVLSVYFAIALYPRYQIENRPFLSLSLFVFMVVMGTLGGFAGAARGEGFL